MDRLALWPDAERLSRGQPHDQVYRTRSFLPGGAWRPTKQRGVIGSGFGPYGGLPQIIPSTPLLVAVRKTRKPRRARAGLNRVHAYQP